VTVDIQIVPFATGICILNEAIEKFSTDIEAERRAFEFSESVVAPKQEVPSVQNDRQAGNACAIAWREMRYCAKVGLHTSWPSGYPRMLLVVDLEYKV
jgi:hypothetical protein